MRIKVGLALVVLLLVGACGGSDDASTDEPNGAASATEPAAEQDLVAAPGAVGPVEVGMTVDEANATGLFEPREVADDDECKDSYGPIQWKVDTDDLLVGVEDDSVSVLGVRGTVRTAKGVGVGSTLADVEAAYPDAEVEESVALGSTIYRQDGDKWLGLAFNETPDEIKPTSQVTFMEATVGEKPTTFLSGCGY